MKASNVSKPHLVLFAAILVLIAMAGFVSRASTSTMERILFVRASDLTGYRSSEYGWEILRDGMVFGRMMNDDVAVYLFSLRLFGGDHRYLISLNDDGQPEFFEAFGTGSVSPHSRRIVEVMRSYNGELLADSSALDDIITNSIMSSIQTIANHERARKDANNVD